MGFTLIDEGAPATNRWETDDQGIIRFDVTSHGVTGIDWLRVYLFHVDDITEKVLMSDRFRSTINRKRQIILIPGSIYKGDLEHHIARLKFRRIVNDILIDRGFVAPTLEDVCLIRDYLSDEDIKKMGFEWILPLHARIIFTKGDFSRYLCLYPKRAKGTLCAMPLDFMQECTLEGAFAAIKSD